MCLSMHFKCVFLFANYCKMHKYIINHEKIFNAHPRHYNRIFIFDLHKATNNHANKKEILIEYST